MRGIRPPLFTAMFDNSLKQIILEKYLIQALNTFPRVISKTNHYQFACNICGDSKKNKGVKRGHLMLCDKEGLKYWVYKCWNEGCPAFGDGQAWAGERWLKYTDTFIHRSFFMEFIKSQSIDDGEKIKEETNRLSRRQIEKTERNARKQKEENVKKEEHYVKDFVPILNGSGKLFDIAIEMCKKRQIPESIWSKFFICDGGGSSYKNRLIIPFYDDYDQIYYWQARALLDGMIPKYLNRNIGKTNNFYNIYNIDRSKPVIAVEGPIDSVFIENSIALCGVSFDEESQKTLDNLDIYYLFDNDATGRRKALEFLNRGDKVFLWKRFKYYNKYDEKQDINDIYIKNKLQTPFTFESLREYFSTSIYSSIFI